MAKVTRDGNLISIGDAVRVESGPEKLTGVATPELLADDVTANHYWAGPREVNGEQVVGRDAVGEEIVLGQPMTYLDWLNDHGFYVYRKRELSEAEQAERETSYTYIWEEVAFRKTEDGAISYAQTLAGGEA